MKTIFIINLLCLCMLLGCTENNLKSTKETHENTTSHKICNDYLFVDFCAGINQTDYKEIENSLLSNQKLTKTGTTLEYTFHLNNKVVWDSSKISSHRIVFNVEPTFENDSLKLIRLTFIRVENQLPKDNIGSYNISIRKLFETKYSHPEKTENELQDKIIYLWKQENKVIQFIEHYNLKWDMLKRKNYKALTQFEILFTENNYFFKHEKQTKEQQEEQNDNERKKEKSILEDI